MALVSYSNIPGTGLAYFCWCVSENAFLSGIYTESHRSIVTRLVKKINEVRLASQASNRVVIFYSGRASQASRYLTALCFEGTIHGRCSIASQRCTQSFLYQVMFKCGGVKIARDPTPVLKRGTSLVDASRRSKQSLRNYCYPHQEALPHWWSAARPRTRKEVVPCEWVGRSYCLTMFVPTGYENTSQSSYFSISVLVLCATAAAHILYCT